MSNNQSDTPAARALLAAHVAFELEQWRGPAAKQRLRDEINAFWAWAERTPLKCLVSLDTVRAAAERLALDVHLPEQLDRVIGTIADDLIRLDIHRDTRVADVINERTFDDGVDLFIELEALRARLIKRALDSPVYTALATDVLYQGIKDYIFSDAWAIRSIPGVSRFIKGSSSAVSKRLPGLEAQVEKRVKTFIENNTAKTLARSEHYLLESLGEQRIRALAAEIWTAIHDQPLSIADTLDTGELQRLVDFGLRIWRELRETEYVGHLVDEAVTAYFKRYGDEPLTALLGHIGVDRELLYQEAETLAPAVIAGLDETGLLEDLIRRRLAAFYESEAFTAAFAAAAQG